MKQLQSFVSIKECGKTLGISKSDIKNLMSKNFISWKIVDGSYLVDVYEVIHYLSNRKANENSSLFLNKVVCDVIDSLDTDIQKYNSTNQHQLNIPTIVKSWKSGKLYCDTFDVDDLMKEEDFIKKFKKHYYELNFKNNPNPINNYKEKFEVSKSLPLMEGIEYKISIILDYFNTYPLLGIMKMFNKNIFAGINHPLGYTF